MRSIRTKITVLTVCAIVIALTAATLIGVISVRKIGNSSSEEELMLLCETGQKNLDAYLVSVEQSVGMVSSFIEEDLSGVSDEELSAHIDRTRNIFEKTAVKTQGVLTYYYRIDPSVSDSVKGFWYIDLDGAGFIEHQVTDITKYDTADTSKLVWFTVPKFTGEAIWLPPYITENLNVRVISYNVPIYYDGSFIGVVGIEIDYSTIAEQVNNIRLYDNGYAFINDEEGNIICHPRIDVLSSGEAPKMPDGLLGGGAHIRYVYEGVEKQAVCLPLSNGMRLNVTVPISEINGSWHRLIAVMLVVSAVILVAFILLTLRLTSHITKPLRKLTSAAEQVNKGVYDIDLEYEGKDEVGLLSKTFDQLVKHLKVYITDLNSLAYADALTSVHNKGAYDIYLNKLQSELDNSEKKPAFAIAVFDCDDLKSINDRFGHDKGDGYLKSASHMICSVFQHSPVFRTGGDEFAAILRGGDYFSRDELVRLFSEKSRELCASSENEWEHVRVAVGIAVFDPENDDSVEEVARRADRLMYENKSRNKGIKKHGSGISFVE